MEDVDEVGDDDEENDNERGIDDEESDQGRGIQVGNEKEEVLPRERSLGRMHKWAV